MLAPRFGVLRYVTAPARLWVFLLRSLSIQALALPDQNNNKTPADMPHHTEPRSASGPQDPELDATDGGWDPYVTSLLAGGRSPGGDTADGEDDGVPVMSLARVEGKRPRPA
jgi:hypothetical protein